MYLRQSIMPAVSLIAVSLVVSIVVPPYLMAAPGESTSASKSENSPASPDHDAKLVLIRELLSTSRATRNAQLGYDTVIDQQMRGLHVALVDRIDKDAKLSAEQKQEAKRLLLIRLNKRMARAKQLMQELINMPQLVSDSYVKSYDKFFTTQEIKDMLSWYKSASGQKMLDVLPEMTNEMTKEVNQTLMPKLKQLDQQLLSEEKEGKFDP